MRLKGGRPGQGAARRSRWREILRSAVKTCGRAVLRRYLIHQLRRTPHDLYHEPNFIPLPGPAPTVATIHDLSALQHPQWHPVDRVRHFERYFHRGLRHCSHFLSISEWGKTQIVRELGVPGDRVTCTYMGVRPGLRPLPREEVTRGLGELGLPPTYLLYLGTIEPRKNVATLLRAYCDLPAWVRQRCPLVLVGGWGWKTREVARQFEDEARHKGVVHLGYLPDDRLGVVYNGARALVFPSFYEGFGLPPVEMMACGGAVLASTAGAVAETAGGQAHLIEPLDVVGWRQAMQRVILEDDWHAELCRGAVEHAAPYTWEACARATWKVYRSVSDRKASGGALAP
jgi:alpha-1,3-rhamnosyl/mannosyltransferase